MKPLLLAAIVAMATSGPAWAQSTGSLGSNIMNDPGPRGGSGGAIGGGLNLGHVFTGAGAGSLASGTTTNIGAGFAATSPIGGISRGLGASMGQSDARSGAAITGGVSNNIGVGGGFTNVLP